MKEIYLGQEWYFYKDSCSYSVYKIETISYQYYNGKISEEDSLVYLKSENNIISIKYLKEFNENNCKLIKDSKFKNSGILKIIPVKMKNRLQKIIEE